MLFESRGVSRPWTLVNPSLQAVCSLFIFHHNLIDKVLRHLDKILCFHLFSVARVVIGFLTCFAEMMLAISVKPPSCIRGGTVLAFHALAQYFECFYFISSPVLQAVFCEDTLRTNRKSCLCVNEISSSVSVANFKTRYTLFIFLANAVQSW